MKSGILKTSVIKLRSNRILSVLVGLSIILVIATYFRYRPYSWPVGTEALGCLFSVIFMVAGLLLFRIFSDKLINDSQ